MVIKHVKVDQKFTGSNLVGGAATFLSLKFNERTFSDMSIHMSGEKVSI